MDEAGHVYGVRGGAGGYLETVFRHAARVLFGQTVKGPLQMKTLRNADFKEVSLEVRLVARCKRPAEAKRLAVETPPCRSLATQA